MLTGVEENGAVSYLHVMKYANNIIVMYKVKTQVSIVATLLNIKGVIYTYIIYFLIGWKNSIPFIENSI